jgi:hypothetical protein
LIFKVLDDRYELIDGELLTICTLVGNRYQKRIFRGDDRIVSAVFPVLMLTATSVLQARSPDRVKKHVKIVIIVIISEDWNDRHPLSSGVELGT